MITEVAKLYKRGRNSILEWVIKIEKINGKVNLMMAYGIIDKEHTIMWQNNIKGKNLGKANETTNEEQALLEAQSKVNNKLKEGYKQLSDLQDENAELFFNTKSLEIFLNAVLPEYNTDVNGNEIPMKCQQYYKTGKEFTDSTGKIWDDKKYYYLLNPYVAKDSKLITINFPCFSQPKVNGVRAFIKLVNGKIEIFSKKGLTYNIPHIADWFKRNIDIFDILEDEVIFDGELYIPGKSLQNISSAVKAYQIETLNVKFYLFDIAVENIGQKDRYIKYLYTPIVKGILAKEQDCPIVLVPTITVGNDDMAQQHTDKYISEGYEGAIFRDYNGLYQFGKRPKEIVKLKRTVSAEFEIIGVIPNEKDDTMGKYVCKTLDGEEFKVNPTMDNDGKRELLLNSSSFIGKFLTCTFYEYTDAGIPFHIIDNIVRDYE